MTHRDMIILDKMSGSENGGRSIRLGHAIRTVSGQYAFFTGYAEGKKVAIRTIDLEELLKNLDQRMEIEVKMISHSTMNDTRLKRFVRWIIPAKIKNIITDNYYL